MAALYLLIQHTRQGRLRWRQALGVGLAPAALGVVSLAWGYPLLMQSYDTAVPLGTFQAMMAVGLGMAWIGMFLMLVCAAAVVLAVRPQGREVLALENRRRWGRDALVAAALALALMLAFGHLRGLVLNRFHAQALLSTGVPSDFAMTTPAVPALAGTLGGTLLGVGLLALGVFLVETLGKRRWLLVPLGVLAVAARVPGEVHTGGELALSYGLSLVGAAGLVAWVVWFARGNYLAYVLAFWVWAVAGQAESFLVQPAAELRRQGWIVVVVGVAGALWAGLAGRRKA